MYNTFQIDADEDLSENKSSRKAHLNERNDKKFMAGTITKNFFTSGFEQDESEYMGQTSPSKQDTNIEKRQGQRRTHEGKLRRDRKTASKLEPINQSKQVQAYQNTQKQTKNEEIDEIQLTSQLNSSMAFNNVSKRSPRRRTKKEQEEHYPHVIAQKRQEQPKEKEQTFKLPNQQNKPNQIFFDDDDGEEGQQSKQQPVPTINFPQSRLNNQFVDSDDQPIQVTTQQIENVITGSEYFNFSNEVTLVKQLYIDVRERTTLKMEIIRDKDGFNTFWPEFHLHFAQDSHYVMSAKKTSSRPTSTFILSRTRNNFQEQGPQYLGKMKSNVLGDILNIFGPGTNPSNAKDKGIQPRQLLATVVFMTSLFQMGKPRQFRVFIKRPQYQYYKDFPQVKMYDDEISLSDLAEFPENKDKIRVLHNRQPVWMKQLGGYMLNFRGRVQRPSIKNFILQQTVNGPEILLFGKLNESKFAFDVSSRISTYIAFGVALSSFDSRLMCQ